MSLREVGVFGAAGVLMAVLIVAGVMMSGLKLPGFYNKGTLVVKLTDAPFELKHLNVTITELEVHKTQDGGWIPLTFVDDKPWYGDILALQNITRDLSVTEIDPGNYTKLRMRVSTANATYVDGRLEDLEVPSGKIDVIVHFEIKVGETTTLLVDMTAHISNGNNTNRLSPVLKAIVID